MEKGFYEVHRMNEYQVMKIVSHSLFDKEIYVEQKWSGAERKYAGRYPKHWHRSLELFYVSGAGCTVWHSGKTRKLREDDLEVINSGEAHEFYDFQDGEKKGCSVIISYSFIKELLPEFDELYFVVQSDHPAYHRVTGAMMKILHLSQNTESYRQLMLRSAMYELLYLLVKYFCVKKNSVVDVRTQKYAERYKKILEYIKQHYNESLTLSEVAEQFALTQVHLSRTFKEYVGINFTRYIKVLRVQKAKELLLKTDLNILDIALQVGEPDAKTLIHDFKREYGMTPKQYRQEYEKLEEC